MELKALFPKPICIGCCILLFGLTALSADSRASDNTIADLILTVFGGVRNGSNYFSYLKAIQWLLVGLTYTSAVALNFDAGTRGMNCITLIRYGSIEKWWRTKTLSTVLGAYIFSGIAFFVVAVIGTLGHKISLSLTGEYNGASINGIWLIFSTWCAFMGTLTLTITTLSGSLQTTATIMMVTMIVPVVIGWVYPEASTFLFGNWGMFKRSSLIDTVHGFQSSSVLLFEYILMTILYAIGYFPPIKARICNH